MDELIRLQRRGGELFQAGQYHQALELFDQALGCWPTVAQLWNNRGTVLIAMGRFGEAAQAYQQALDLSPTLHQSRVALATCLKSLGDHARAISCCEKVLAMDPLNAQAHWNLALLLLQVGDYARGWREYEWRWETARGPFCSRSFAKPRWQGEDLREKTILIHAEQGFGDAIQFCRFLPPLAEKGGCVLFQCPPPLHRLMRSLPPEVELLSPEEAPEFTYHLPLLSLPLLLHINSAEALPAPERYLFAGQQTRDLLQGEEPCWDRRLQVGLCWETQNFPLGRNCPVELLDPLGDAWADLHSLQLESTGRPSFSLIDRTASIRDFYDTAALIEELDLVISVDTSVAHLACALGKPTFILLPFDSDWRWGIGSDRTPWYPTARLVRQRAPGEWGPSIREVRDLLDAMVSGDDSRLGGNPAVPLRRQGALSVRRY